MIDGRIYDTGLIQYNKSREWLKANLGENSKNLSEIALATYNPATDMLSVRLKTHSGFSKRLK